MAKRHECLNRAFAQCTRGNGAPRRSSCAYCGGQVIVYEGAWAVVNYRSDGRYHSSNTRRIFQSELAAQRHADKLYNQGENVVVRWLYA